MLGQFAISVDNYDKYDDYHDSLVKGKIDRYDDLASDIMAR